MSGAMFLLAPCYICNVVFTSNPLLVPSYQGNPICRSCIEGVNRRREDTGLPHWPVLPGAYDPEECA